MATNGIVHRAVLRAALGFVLAGACAAPRAAPVPDARATLDARDLGGVTLAENSGPTLIVLSIDPARMGDNTAAVELRDPSGAVVSGAVRLDVSIDGRPVLSALLPSSERRHGLAVGSGGRADVRAVVVDGAASGASATFSLDLPVERALSSTLADIDAAMRQLHSLRETQTLTSGGPPVLFQLEYAAPDRVRYTTARPSGPMVETRVIGRERFDREGAGAWTRTDIGFASRVPSTDYARGAERVRLIGHGRSGSQDIVEIAFVQQPGVYYHVWAGVKDHLVRRYVMMAKGHYMTGTYSDYDVPIAISAP